MELKNGKITEGEIDPTELGLSLCPPEDLKGRDGTHNALLLKGILEGFESPLRDVVLLNAAAAFYVAGKVKSFRDGFEWANHIIGDRALEYKVNKIKEFCSKVS